jgi:hypothetical protein
MTGRFGSGVSGGSSLVSLLLWLNSLPPIDGGGLFFAFEAAARTLTLMPAVRAKATNACLFMAEFHGV